MCVCVCVKWESSRSGLQSEGNRFSVWFGNRGMRRGYSVGGEEQVFKTIEKKKKKLYPYYTIFCLDNNLFCFQFVLSKVVAPLPTAPTLLFVCLIHVHSLFH